MNKLDLLGPKFIFKSPSEKVLTNAIVDAIDSVRTSTDLYVLAHTSTLRDDFQEINYRSVATDIDLAADYKFAIGAFLSNDSSLGNMLFNVNMNLSFTNETASQGALIIPFFGRCDASTVTASDVAPANLLSSYISLQPYGRMANVQRTQYAWNTISINQDVLVDNSDLNSDPICAGFIFQNAASGTATLISNIYASICLRSNYKVIDAYRPSGI